MPAPAEGRARNVDRGCVASADQTRGSRWLSIGAWHSGLVHRFSILSCNVGAAAGDGPGCASGQDLGVADGGRRLLVVDAGRIQRLIVTRAVESVGFTVDGAANLD